MRRARPASWAVCFALLLGITPPGLAHDPGLSALTLELQRGQVAAHLVVARREIERLVAIDADGDGAVSPDELAVARLRLQALAANAIELESEGPGPPISQVAVELDDSDALHLRVARPGPANGQISVRVSLIARLALGHREYVQVRDDQGRLLAEHILQANSPGFTVTRGDAAPALRGRGFREFFSLGVEHIATGYDHLLFLLALLIVGPGLPSAVRIITSFTAAHSVTLALATFDVVRLAPAIVEPLIAVSVLYVGTENLLRRRLEHRWMLTFAFGLVHGLGFAAALRDVGLGAAGAGAVVPLLAFNLGVESGQLILAGLALPLIWRVQRQPRVFARVATAGSVLVVLAGAGWLAQRTLLS